MVKRIVSWIKEKQELASLQDEIVLKALLKETSVSKIDALEKKSDRDLRKNKEAQTIVKGTRSRLRETYGVFWQNMKKRDSLLATLVTNPSKEFHEELLKLHPSTKERLPYYEELYEKLFSITRKPKTIIDLAAGLNPLSYPWLECTPKYIANELTDTDAKFIQSYFNEMNINGEAIAFDLLSETEKLKEYSADVCLLLKTIDSLEAAERHCSSRILETIRAPWIACSFPTASLGGRKTISTARRAWLDNLAADRGWTVTKFSIPGEAFFLIKKS
jgi:16S rRNA (guanine(1405)-N(7))-methyltransferase